VVTAIPGLATLKVKFPVTEALVKVGANATWATCTKLLSGAAETNKLALIVTVSPTGIVGAAEMLKNPLIAVIVPLRGAENAKLFIFVVSIVPPATIASVDAPNPIRPP
jgi:hypothetical protein